ncbi:MAG: VCBS repeat-containing protein [Bacteroidetes bacterium]|nr:VCBS repeat-containing protein [Bacteroidota bacterium]
MKYPISQILKSGLILFYILLFALILDAQTISSFVPSSGPVGTSVILTGTGFDATPTNNIVFFGATTATVSAASATSLTVTVPTGANYQYITATNLITNLTAYSDKPFIVTTICNSASTFALAISVQGGSHNVEIYDMDGDGKADLIIPDYFNNYFTVTRNTSTPGSISFAAKVTFPWAAGGQPNEVSIGDFDGDGKPDVALGGNGGGAFVSVYRNTSNNWKYFFCPSCRFYCINWSGKWQ